MKHVVVSGCSFTNNFRINIGDERRWKQDPIRCLGSKKQKQYGILPQTILKEGLKKSILEYKSRL